MFKVASLGVVALILFGLTGCGGGNDGDGQPVTPVDRVAVVADDSGSELADFLSSKGLAVDNFPRAGSYNPAISGDYVVWQDYRNGNFNADIYAYRISTGTEFQVTAAASRQTNPRIDGDYIVWQDNRNGNADIYAYQLSTGTEFAVTTATGTQFAPRIDGDYIVWQDDRNGNTDIYAYRISTSTEFAVTTDTSYQGEGAPDIDGGYIVWQDDRNGSINTDIYAYQLSTSTEFAVTTDTSNQTNPRIDGDYIVWQDNRNGNADIYAYQLSTSTEFQVTTAISGEYNPRIDGDYIVWQDNRNGNADVYAYQLSTSTEFQVTTDTSNQLNPRIDGGYIVWQDYRNGNYDLYAYQLLTSTEFQVTTDTSDQYIPRIDGNYIVWQDYRNGYYYDIFLSSTGLSVSEQLISTGKPTLDNTNISDYRVILFGDDLSNTYGLSVFDAADAAGVNMLGIGTYDNNRPLGSVLEQDGRFGLSTSDDYGCSDMEIDVTTDGIGHSIFNGLDTSSTIYLESGGASEQDEQMYSTDPLDPDSPADWKVLATLGSNMCYSGDPTIVEFSTPNGTRVILDGSANTYDQYDYWTQERWNLLYNEVMYLMN